MQILFIIHPTLCVVSTPYCHYCLENDLAQGFLSGNLTEHINLALCMI